MVFLKSKEKKFFFKKFDFEQTYILFLLLFKILICRMKQQKGNDSKMPKSTTGKLQNSAGLVITGPLHHFLFSFFICAFFLLAVLSLFPIQFDKNDDQGIMSLFAGYTTGSPHPVTPFTSIFFGYIVAGLYTIFPAFPCYAIFFISVMFISSVAVSYCISETASAYDIPLIFRILFTLLFLFGFALHPFVLLQFTTVAGFAGAAAVALAITLIPSNGRKSFIRYALIITLCFLSFVIRRESFIPAGLILGSILGFKMLKNPKNILRSKELALISVLTLMIIFLDTFSAYKAKTILGEEHLFWQKNRGQVMDYIGFDNINHEEIGVDAFELMSIGEWCFLTENIEKGIFKKIVDLYGTREGLSFNRLKSAIDTYMSQFSRLTAKFFYIILLSLLFFAVYLRYFVFKEEKGDILKSFNVSNKLVGFMFILYFCFSAYLCFAGRYPLRVYVTMNLILAPITIILLCALYARPLQNIKIKVITASLLIACMFFSVSHLNGIATVERKVSHEKYSNTIEKYALNNPRNFYIFDISLASVTSSPFKVLSAQKPTNLTFWGGWNYFTPSWYEQLKLNGMENLDYTSFLNDNVFLMFRRQPPHYFLKYMQDKFSNSGINVEFRIVDQFNINNDVIYVLKAVIDRDGSNK